MFKKCVQGFILWYMKVIGSISLRRMKKSTKGTLKKSEKFLLKTLHDNKDTEYGKKYHFADIHSIEEYKKAVPLSDYDTYRSYVMRMADEGEKDLITAYRIKTFTITSGSVGEQKLVPISKKALSKYTKYSITRAAALGAKFYKNRGRRAYIGTTLNTMEIHKEPLKSGYKKENVSSAATSIMRPFMPYTHTSPMPVFYCQGKMNKQYMTARFALEDRNVANMISVFMSNLTDVMNYIKNNWQMIVDDIENGTINDSVCDEEGKKNLARYIKKNPKRAKELREIFSQGFDTPFIPKVWKKISWITTIGHAGFATQTEIMRTYLGNDVPIDYSIFSPSEGMIAVPQEINSDAFLLLVDCCFCEFLPIDDENSETLTLDQLEVGKEYEVIMTTQSGFYRYFLRDVVRVLGYDHECPLISFVYRKNMMASVAGEKTSTEHFDEVIKLLGEKIGCNIVDYCVFVDTKAEPGRYEIYIEPQKKIDHIDLDEMGEYADECLKKVNPHYRPVREKDSIGRPIVRLQKQNTHAEWKEYRMKQGYPPAQMKPLRLLNTPERYEFFSSRIEK